MPATPGHMLDDLTKHFDMDPYRRQNMTHQIPSSEVITEDQRNLMRHVDAEAPQPKARITEKDKERIWTPASQHLAMVVIPGLIKFFNMLPEVAVDSAWTLIGISVVMAAVARFAPPETAAVGMVASLILVALISTLYFIRYRREDHMQETLERLDEHIVELEQALGEKLDLIERNVV